MPLDPSYPQARLSHMLSDAQIDILLTQRHLTTLLPSYAGRRLSLDGDWNQIAGRSEENLPDEIHGDNLAYVIYTSGSTGRPKGAMNTHAGIVNRLCWMQDEYRLTPDDRVLQKTPFSFDVSVWEFFWPLVTGARLVMARPGGHQDSAYLITLIIEQSITTLHFVPSMLQVFLGMSRLDECRGLKRVICSGEALPFDLQQRFFERFKAELHNLYGPTESAVDVTYWQCRPESKEPRVPIGRPIANIQLHILDKRMLPVPVGVAGELHISGRGLARGYLHQPALSAESFIPDPFSKIPGARMYRTGDLTRYLPGGEIEFLGRIDYQVKIRGNRIELGEVETTLAGHPAIREAVVMASHNAVGDKMLVAYIVPARIEDVSESSAVAGFAPAYAVQKRQSRINGRRHKLPNGLMIAHDGEIQFNTMDIYREIFEKEIYLKHGVTLTDGACVLTWAHILDSSRCLLVRNIKTCVFMLSQPLPPTFEALSLNVRHLQPAVKLFNIGVASETKTVPFNYYPRMSGVWLC